MNITPSPGASRRPAIGLLTALVLLAHWAVLRGVPPVVELSSSQAVRPVQLRTLARRPVATDTAPPPAATAANLQRPQARPATPYRARIALLSSGAAAPAAVASGSVQLPERVESEAPSEPLTRPNAVLLAASTRLLYEVSQISKGNSIAGESELLWQNTGQDYQARWEWQLPGTVGRVQTSVGRVTADGLEPIRFADKARTEQAAHFERQRAQIVFSANTPPAALLGGAQDRLSMLFQIGAMMAAEPARFSAGTQLNVQTAGPRDAAIWRLAVAETEYLTLPGGSMAAVKLSHQPHGPYEPRLDLWLAPALGYLPVRWRLTFGNGDWIDHQLRIPAQPW